MNHDMLQTMERRLLSQDLNLLNELYEYGKVTGSLSRATIMQMWHGVSLQQFSQDEVVALFTFLNEKDPFGDLDTLLSRRAPRDGDKLREEYLSEITDDLRRMNEEGVLRKMSRGIEDVFHDDIFNLSADEISAGMSNMGYINRQTVSTELGIIRNYILWCRDKGYQTISDEELSKVKLDTIGFKKSFLAALVPTPAKLAVIIETTKAADTVKTDVALIILYWLGFTVDEARDLLERDVNLLDGTIQHEHFGEIKVPQELIGFLREYSSQDIVYGDTFTHIADKTEYFIHKYALAGTPLTGERYGIESMKALLSRFNTLHRKVSKFPVHITTSKLNISGACYRLYQREMNGEVLTRDIMRFESRKYSTRSFSNFRNTYREYKEIFFPSK